MVDIVEIMFGLYKKYGTDNIKKLFKIGQPKPMTFEVGEGLTPEQKIQAEQKIKTLAETGKGLPESLVKPISLSNAWNIQNQLLMKRKKGEQLTPEMLAAGKEAGKVIESFMMSAVIGSISPIKIVSPVEAEKLIAKAVNLTRADLQDITAGVMKDKVKLDAYKTMTQYPELKERLSSIARDEKIPLVDKITNYIKDLLPKETQATPFAQKATKLAIPPEKGIIPQEARKEIENINTIADLQKYFEKKSRKYGNIEKFQQSEEYKQVLPFLPREFGRGIKVLTETKIAPGLEEVFGGKKITQPKLVEPSISQAEIENARVELMRIQHTIPVSERTPEILAKIKRLEEVIKPTIPPELQPLAQRVKNFEELGATEKGFGAGIGPKRIQQKGRLAEDEIGNWFYDHNLEIPKLESPYTYAKKVLESPEEFIARELKPTIEIPIRKTAPEFLGKGDKPYSISYTPEGKTYKTREAFYTLEEAQKRVNQLTAIPTIPKELEVKLTREEWRQAEIKDTEQRIKEISKFTPKEYAELHKGVSKDAELFIWERHLKSLKAGGEIEIPYKGEVAGKPVMRTEIYDAFTGYNQAVKGVKEVKPKIPIAPAETPPIKPPIPPSPAPIEMPQFAREPVGDPIAKLNALLKEAKPLRKGLETAYTTERAKRIADVERFINEQIDQVGGEEGYAKILAKLKGELVSPEAKIAFEPIKDKLTEAELKDLFIRTWKHPYLDNWEKISAANGLMNLLGGGIPQPKQLVLLEEIYGTDLVKNLLSKRLWGAKAIDFVVEVMNIPRALLATADMSAFLRQGIIPLVAHPTISIPVVGKTFQFAFSQKAFDQYFKDLSKDPLYPLMRKSGLAITDPSKASMVNREEAFISRLLQKIPIIKIPVKFAERSYVGFLNKVRVDLFKTWADEFLSKGLSPIRDIDYFKSIANVVNTFTGRGGLGKLDRITPELNTIFFSPRLVAARFNALNPVWYARMPKEIRMKAISDFAKFVAVGLTTLALIKLYKESNDIPDSELNVETDTRSSDSGKIKIGNTRWDIWGGFQQWARVFAQLITGERKNTSTGEIVSLSKDEYPFTTRKETLLRFIEGKLAPVPALINELMSGAKTFTGEDMTFETVAKEKFIPMYIQDIADAYKDGGLGRAVGVGIAAFFGVGVQTWEEQKKFLSPEGMPQFQIPGMPGTKLPPMPGIKSLMPGVGLPPMPGILK